MKILVVDDEAPSRRLLSRLLHDLDDSYEVLTAENGHEALSQVKERKPAVVLMDIRMPVMDGMEAAFHLAALPDPPAVIFVTAYDKHALKAFELNALDYLLKPVSRKRLKEALGRIRPMLISAVRAIPLTRSHITVPVSGKGMVVVPVEDIRYLRAEHKYLTVTWSAGEALLEESLKTLEAEFGNRFLRIHRNTLVAKRFVREIRILSSVPHIILQDVTMPLPVSRRHIHAVRKSLKKSTD